MEIFVITASSVVFLGCAAVLLLRFLANTGIPIGKTPAANTALPGSGEKVKKSELAAVFAAALGFRVFMLLLQIMLVYWFTDFPDSEWLSHIQGYWNKLLCSIQLQDGPNYYRIAEGGYGGFVFDGKLTTLVFFPLYPWIARFVALAVGNVRAALIITSILSYCGGAAALYKLAAIDYPKETAKKAVLYISVFPFSFFFGTMMTESLLFLTLTLTLYFIRTHKWLAAGIMGALTAMTRIVGVLVIVPAAIEFAEHYKLFIPGGASLAKRLSLIFRRGLWLLIIPLGVCVYLYVNYYYTGNPFTFMEYQKSIWGHESCYFGRGIYNVIHSLFDSESRTAIYSISLPFALTVIGSAILLFYGIRRGRTMYTAFSLIYIIVICSVTWIPSGGRYMSCVVPLFIFLADYAQRHKNADMIITVMFAILQGIYFTACMNNMSVF